MMKQITLFLMGGAIIMVILLAAIVNIFSDPESAQTAILVPLDPTITHLEDTLREQEAAHQAQLAALAETLQRQQTETPNQIKTLTRQVTTVEQDLKGFQEQAQTLQSEIAQLESTRTSQLTTYPTRLAELQQLYNQRQIELAEARAELVKIEAELAQ